MINPHPPDPATLYWRLKKTAESLGDLTSNGELAQEVLDFLAMATGLKPVCLLGRGLDAPEWIDAASDLARETGFHVLVGPFWDATPFGKFPSWYRDHTAAQLAPFTATYICSSRDTADDIAAINEAGGRLSMTVEARLLGYPECCVVAHYDRTVRYHQALLSILKRLSGGDDSQMQILLNGRAALAPQSSEEISLMETAFDINPAPYGSWNRCPHCARNDPSPSSTLSEKYRALAEEIDPDLRRTLSGG